MRIAASALSFCFLITVFGATAVGRDLHEPTRFFRTATKVVSNLNDGFDQAIRTHRRLLDDATLKLLSEQIGNLDAKLAQGVDRKQSLVSPLRLYLENPTKWQWETARKEMDVVANIVVRIVTEIDRSQPDLVQVAEPAQVANLLTSGSTVTAQMQSLPEAVVSEDRSELMFLVERYDALLQQLRRLNEKLEKYVISFRAEIRLNN